MRLLKSSLGAFRGSCAAVGMLALLGGFSAQAAWIDMPVGGTSWIEASSNACDLGTPALGADCFGAPNVMPTGEYALEPLASFIAGGQVTPDSISLQNTGGQGGFAWGASGGMFTVQGAGNAPVMVTAIMHVIGEITKAGPISLGSASWKMGAWVFDAVTSELNQRVTSQVSDGALCTFVSCSGLAFDRELVYQFMALPGQAFSLGYQLTTSTLGTSQGVTVAAQASFSVLVGEGYFVTGTNGYDSRVTAVPEPQAWALLVVGLATVVWCRRRSGTMGPF